MPFSPEYAGAKGRREVPRTKPRAEQTLGLDYDVVPTSAIGSGRKRQKKRGGLPEKVPAIANVSPFLER